MNMKHESSIKSWPGCKQPMDRYDFLLHKAAVEFLSLLGKKKSAGLYMRIFGNKNLRHGISGMASDFVCRNPFHETSDLVCDEFKRVYGRKYNPLRD